MSKLEYRFEMRFNYRELDLILDCISKEICKLKVLFEDLSPLSDDEKEYLCFRYEDLKILLYLERCIRDELYSD